MGSSGDLRSSSEGASTVAAVAAPLRLDLGSGDVPKIGFEGVDLFAPAARHRVNLCRFPWPWADSSVEALHCSHFLEHLPAVYVTPDGAYSEIPTSADDRDLLCRFMDEAYRVLAPGGGFHIVVPSARSNRAFQDPTHRRFFVSESFWYFNHAWREERGIGHYLCSCDFDVRVWPVVPDELLSLPEYEQSHRYHTQWNTTLDWCATLTSRKSRT
jgi:hypothetical protein